MTESGLGHFYQLKPQAGVRRTESRDDRYRVLDEPTVRAGFVDFSDGTQTRVTFRLPAIHCIACVWLLENLFRLRPGIGVSRVDFPRREVAISFLDAQVPLSDVAQLLDSLGYPPDLKLADLDAVAPATDVRRRLWLQLGVAGFVFGNSMLLSLPGYFGLDAFSGPGFRSLAGWLHLALGLPVVVFSAADYWKRAWLSFRIRRMTIEVPIAIGIGALFLQSAYEVASGQGEGYFDSLAGLIFFLLCGRWFQEKSYDRMTFDRDYRSFFPLSVRRQSGDHDESVSLSQLEVGDRINLRHGELVPADARLLRGAAVVDYSFVTGESEPVEKKTGEILYAGGRQAGGAISVELVKPVSQSYLTSLWNQEVFGREKLDTFDDLTNRYSQRFTWTILAIAVLAAGFWLQSDPARAIRSFVGVLIVACPCALALAAPFTLGAALRELGRRGIFVRKAAIVEQLSRIDTVVFDKTGTLTAPGLGEVSFEGAPLTPAESLAIRRLAAQSTHPLAQRLADGIIDSSDAQVAVEFREDLGGGMEGTVAGQRIQLGSEAWLSRNGATAAGPDRHGLGSDRIEPAGSSVGVAIDQIYRGRFTVVSPLRAGASEVVTDLSRTLEVALLSGDNERDHRRLSGLFGPGVELRFHQSPHDKLDYIRARQSEGRCVLMAGDGLNDAGALRQSNVGVAVVEHVGVFSPASDVILSAAHLPLLPGMLAFARQSVGIVHASFALSAAYNAVGIAIAASGRLEPIVCAILMPLSSVSVVALAVGLTHWAGRSLDPRAGGDQKPISAKSTPSKGRRA